MPNKKIPYLIVGQGIAGSLVAWFLEKRNIPYFLIDRAYPYTASRVAAGIINPITGRRFVKSWMIDTLLPFAKRTYLEIQATLGIDLWKEPDIIRFFRSNAEGNNWLNKTTWADYDEYLIKDAKKKEVQDFIEEEIGYGVVRGARADLGILVHSFRNYFLQKDCLLEEQFDYNDLQLKDGSVDYKNIQAQKIIFCEGYAAAKNPWFDHLPYEAAKGEVLLLRIPELKTLDIIKKQHFLVPLGDDLFWFGSNYEWKDLSATPTAAGKQFLIEGLNEILKTDYEIIAHKAAVRPVFKDRRPVMGVHPKHPQITIFNGMGTKGTSIAPYWANHFVTHLADGTPIPKEVHVQRFKS